MLRAHLHISPLRTQTTPLTLERPLGLESNFLVIQIWVYVVLDQTVTELDRFQHTMAHGTPKPPIHVSKFITCDNNMLERIPVRGMIFPYRGI